MLTWSFSRHAVIQCSAMTQHNKPALKEWQPTIHALDKGMQTVLFRKGGIREPLFTPRASTFLLFPTAFHADTALLKPAAAARLQDSMATDPRHEPMLHLASAARVTGAWSTSDPALLERLDHLHIYTPAFVDARLRWRPNQKLTVLELRVGACMYWSCFATATCHGGAVCAHNSTTTPGRCGAATPQYKYPTRRHSGAASHGLTCPQPLVGTCQGLLPWAMEPSRSSSRRCGRRCSWWTWSSWLSRACDCCLMVLLSLLKRCDWHFPHGCCVWVA